MYGTQTMPVDLVRLVKPDATDDEAGFLLWECSSFPFGGTGHWFSQVREAVAAMEADPSWTPYAEGVEPCPTSTP